MTKVEEKAKKTSKYKEQLTTIRPSFFINLLKESKLFISFSLLTCLLPIIYCLISSLIKPNGSQAVMAIGYVAPFLLAFMQISFSMSMIIFAQINKLKENDKFKWKNEHTITSSAIWMSLSLGLVMVVFYILSSFLYMYFANNRPNTQATMIYGFDFIANTIIFIFFLPLLTTLIFYIHYRKEKLSLILTFTFFGLMILFSYLFGIVFNWKIAGIGSGSTFAMLILVAVALYIVKIKYKIIIYFPSQVKHFNLLISKIVMKESLTSISLSVFKGIAIVCLSFVIPLTISGFVPLAYQMSRVLWFNMMYFIPFLGIGIGEAIRAHYLGHTTNDDCPIEHSWKKDLVIVICTFLITGSVAIGCVFLVNPLVRIYVKNDYNPFYKSTMPEIEGWGIPTPTPDKFIEPKELLTELPKLDWAHFPKLTPLKPNPNKNPIISAGNALITAANIKKIDAWTNIQIRENPNLKVFISNLSEWIKWLNQANEKGITLSQFIGTKYDVNITKIISLIAANDLDGLNSELNKLVPLLKSGMSYFVYLWLYSNTNSVVTESFINLRHLLNYKDLISQYTSQDGKVNVVQLLSNNKIEDILPSLFLKIQTFNAKSMIYVCVFSTLNSVWAILLQTNTRNYKKGMPYWLMIIVYFICIGGLVTFGVLFGVTFKNQLGKNNPFQYLDAWTFPLIIIASFAILVVGTKALFSYKHL